MKPLLTAATDYGYYNYPEELQAVAQTAWMDGYREAKINTRQRSWFWFFAGVVLTVLFCLLAGVCFGQDSIRLTVTKARSGTDRTYYWLRDDQQNRYYTVCSCKQRHVKGDTVMIAKKDMEFIPGKVKYQ